MHTHRIENTSTNPEDLMKEVYLSLNKRNVGNGPDDPPVAILIQTTGKFKGGEAVLKATVFEGHESDFEISLELAGLDEAAPKNLT